MRLLHGRASGGRVMSLGLSLYKPGQAAPCLPAQRSRGAASLPRRSSARHRLAFAPRRRDALAFRGPHAGAFPNHGCGTRIAPPKDSS